MGNRFKVVGGGKTSGGCRNGGGCEGKRGGG